MSSPPFKVKAVYEYTSPHDDDLHFSAGQIITVTEEEGDDWYVGEYVDASGERKDGLFPKNFVEKYEPTAPPRPTRTTRPKKDPEPTSSAPEPIPEPVKEHIKPVKEPEPEVEPEAEQEDPSDPVTTIASAAPKPDTTSSPPAAKPTELASSQPLPKPAPVKQSAPPPVSDKPAGGSFRDRIAAFNKAAPPPAPFKPGGLGSGSNTFIKKPFVAPPPSKNAYVPPPRDPVQPQKVYRREEDPEIVAREQENQEQAQKAGLVPAAGDGDEEDQPKPTSLKERIALLQKQQMEQAQRHAEAAAKKEKPKRPAKKRVDSYDTVGDDDGATLEKTRTEDTIGNHSIEPVQEEVEQPRRRKPSRGASSGTQGVTPRKSFGDGNDADLSGAGDTTEEHDEVSTSRDESDEKPKTRAPPPPVRAPSTRPPPPAREPDVGDEEGTVDEEEAVESEEEEEDVDPEVRRREELRARMAKMSGGMGMHGMFGPVPVPSAAPKKKKHSGGSEKYISEHVGEDTGSPSTRAPPVPMIPLPGLTQVKSPEETDRQIGDREDDPTGVSSIRPADVVPDLEDVVPSSDKPPHTHALPPTPGGAPPVPTGRPVPPPVPMEARPVPPPPAPLPLSPSAGSESDDEMSERPRDLSITSPLETPKPHARADGPASPTSPSSRRASYFPPDSVPPTSPTSAANKRASRVPPPIPGAPQAPQPQTRAPPPPPPEASLSRSATGEQRTRPTAQEEDSDEEVTEYEGDVDTDIASAAPHKDALKTHGKEQTQDDDSFVRSPVISPSSAPPPLPSVPRSGPPPLPTQPPPPARQSSDMPRGAPPPPPPGKLPAAHEDDDDEYDPYRYTAPRLGIASIGGHPSSRVDKNDEDLYSASSPDEAFSPPPPSHERAVPPPPPQERAAPPPPPREAPQQSRAAPRQSTDVHRPTGPGRRSVELSRMSMDSGFVANEVDLAPSSAWWTKPDGTPPVFHGRKDILYEFDESSSTKRGGKTLVTKDLYILFQDYSQTVITAQYDPQDAQDARLEQRHEQPPARLRQDQLEQAHEQFGRGIYDAVVTKKDTVVGDGTPQALVQELLKPFSNALLPIGTRAYGAIVYANLANASTTQNDEIRPGDIITFRNTKFQGKHGAMHAKYSVDVGKPDHVGVVAEWDGTKKKVRAWEQGRESKKTKLESFKLDDLRSGEVKIWRVMPRSWVGWQGQN